MFAPAAPAPPTLSATVDPATSTPPPTPSGRLRGLAYLRHYTQHLHGHSTPISPRSASPRSATQPLSASPERPTRRRRGQSASRSSSRHEADPAEPASDHFPSGPTSASSHAGGDHRRPGRSSTRLRSRSRPRSRTSPAEEGASSCGPPPGAMVMGRKKTPAASAVTTTESTVNDVAADLSGATSSPQQHMPSIRLIPHQDPRATRPSLLFSPISRTLPSHAAVIRVGRYSEKDSEPPSSTNTPSAAPVGFKSKVVSRRHCELWCANGQWHIKDVKSSSGTFLNHIRLSQPNSESKPFPVNDGDVIQLGIDFKGGEEMIFRCVKIRVECNRGWQKALNNFNTTTHKRLRDLAAVTTDSKGITPSSECSICLFSIAPCQSLFVAPCSHVWHYSCIRPILNGTTWPQFLCPNCRAVADLEAEVDEPSADWARQLNDADAVPASRDAALVSTPLGPNGEVAPPPDKRPGKEEPERPASNLADAVGALTLEATEPGDGASDPPLPLRESDFPSGTHAPSVRPSLASRRSDSVQALDLAAPSTPSGTGTSVRQASRELSDNWLSSDRETDAADTTVHSPDPPGPDGPLTPTNDAGPFVFDGSAGREAEA